VARSRNHCCHGNSTVPYVDTVVDLHIAVNNRSVQFCIEFNQGSLYTFVEIQKFRTAVNNINVLRSSCKVTDVFVQL